MPIPKGYKRKRIANWKRVCAKGSIRTVVRGKVRILVCCPRGKWKPRAERCKVGTRAVSIDKPRAFGAVGPLRRVKGLDSKASTRTATSPAGRYFVFKDYDGVWVVTFRATHGDASRQIADAAGSRSWKSRAKAVKAMRDHEKWHREHFGSLATEARKEHREHPWTTMKQARQIARDHARKRRRR